MAKELPYFQFEPAEYLTKDISFCSLSAQGLFINICSYYWQRQCQLSKEQFLRRFNYPNEFEELLNEGVIDEKNDEIIVKFLDIQFSKATEFSKEQARKGSLGGRPKKPNESRMKAEIKPNESRNKAIIEDKIIKENIIKEEIKKENKNEFFLTELLNSHSWLETISMQNKLKLEETKMCLNKFNLHLESTMEEKSNKKDFASHFVNWLKFQETKPKQEVKPKYKCL